jgi:3-hydroxypropionyl-CoA synthetase (ADP-forming)
LNLGSAHDVARGFAGILAAVRRQAPQARVHGIRVEEMCAQGVEVIIGLTRDPQFGPCIMFGLGGVLTELLEDVSFRVLPLTMRDAMDMINEVRGRAILDGYRGQPPVSREMLAELLLQVGRLGMDVAAELGAVDLNPVVVWGDDYRVLDAKFLLDSEPTPVRDGTPSIDHVETFFYPRSVALIGASATPGKIGHAILDSLLRAGYTGSIHPINPARDEVMGKRAYPSVKDVPGPVDLVVVALPLAATPGLVADCAAKGVRNIVIISGGGKELGGDSQALESRIVSLAREHGIRIVGPNCIGVVNPAVNLDTLFMVRERMTRPRPGRIAMITQSGTVGVAFLEAAAQVGISKFVSYGNRADVDEADLLAYLAGDDQTATIACYVEGFSDGRKFLQAARAVNPRKPIVIFKAGRSHQGARASLSHTGFFGGRHAVSRGAFRQAGLVDVDTVEQLYEAAKALTLQPAAAGPRVGMISNGAGTVIQAIDLLASAGLELTELAQATEDNLKRLLPSHCIAHNPVDVTGSASAEDYRLGIQGLTSDAGVDIVMPWFVFQDTPLGEDIVHVLGDLSRSSGKPIVCGAMGGTYTDRMANAIEEAGVPVARSVSAWIAAARALVISGRRREPESGEPAGF